MEYQAQDQQHSTDKQTATPSWLQRQRRTCCAKREKTAKTHLSIVAHVFIMGHRDTAPEVMNDSPTPPRPTRSLKPQGVDPAKVKRHSTQSQTRQRHYYQNTPREGIDDIPTQKDSWDGSLKPTTTRPLKPREVDPVKVKRHSTHRKTRQRH